MKSSSISSIAANGKDAGTGVDIANIANIIGDIAQNGLIIEVEG